jgi:ketopantoate hydroxymethyltransferase
VERALDSAARYLKEGGAQAVKVEGGQAVLPAVRMMT